MLCNKPRASGTGKFDAEKDKKCPIFYTFGHASDGGGGNAGTVSLGDAYILFSPVPTLAGRVWVTSKAVLTQFGYDCAGIPDDKVAVPTAFLQGCPRGINLGWLWFDAEPGPALAEPAPRAAAGNDGRVVNVTDYDGGLAVKLQAFANVKEDDPEPAREAAAKLSARLTEMSKRIVIVPDDLLAPIVNSNLEVRTSVAIDQKTGTADSGKLFSYEAIPRETVLFSDVIVDDYRQDAMERMEKNDLKWQDPYDVVRDGLAMMGTLGVGGMGTRGFGRLALRGEVRL
jgi:CRISPR-associated protein Cmr4